MNLNMWRNNFFMNVRHKAHVKWPLVLLCICALTLFLVGCGDSGGTTSTTPTPSATGQTYTGNGYTVSYPLGWTYAAQGSAVVFKGITDPTATLTIAVTPATPIAGLDQAFTAAETLLKNNADYQQDTTLPSQVSIGGDSWKQSGGTYNDQNNVHTKSVVLADQHPASTGNIFVITLTAKADSYSQADSTGFQPILQSFKFS
jgi:hypothetical protein